MWKTTVYTSFKCGGYSLMNEFLGQFWTFWQDERKVSAVPNPSLVRRHIVQFVVGVVVLRHPAHE